MIGEMFTLGKSMQCGFGGWIWQMLVSKRNDAQSPKSSDSIFFLTCKPPNSCLVHFPHVLVVEMKSQPTFVTKVRERWTWANTVHLTLPVVERWRTCVQQKDYVIGHCRSSGLMSELLDLWEEPIFFLHHESWKRSLWNHQTMEAIQSLYEFFVYVKENTWRFL